MRIDLFLKKALIIKQRSAAKDLCDKGLVRINGIAAEPSKKIKENDIIEIDTINGVKKYKVLRIPQGNVRKEEVHQYYETCNNNR